MWHRVRRRPPIVSGRDLPPRSIGADNLPESIEVAGDLFLESGFRSSGTQVFDSSGRWTSPSIANIKGVKGAPGELGASKKINAFRKYTGSAMPNAQVEFVEGYKTIVVKTPAGHSMLPAPPTLEISAVGFDRRVLGIGDSAEFMVYTDMRHIVSITASVNESPCVLVPVSDGVFRASYTLLEGHTSASESSLKVEASDAVGNLASYSSTMPWTTDSHVPEVVRAERVEGTNVLYFETTGPCKVSGLRVVVGNVAHRCKLRSRSPFSYESKIVVANAPNLQYTISGLESVVGGNASSSSASGPFGAPEAEESRPEVEVSLGAVNKIVCKFDRAVTPVGVAGLETSGGEIAGLTGQRDAWTFEMSGSGVAVLSENAFVDAAGNGNPRSEPLEFGVASAEVVWASGTFAMVKAPPGVEARCLGPDDSFYDPDNLTPGTSYVLYASIPGNDAVECGRFKTRDPYSGRKKVAPGRSFEIADGRFRAEVSFPDTVAFWANPARTPGLSKTYASTESTTLVESRDDRVFFAGQDVGPQRCGRWTHHAFYLHGYFANGDMVSPSYPEDLEKLVLFSGPDPLWPKGSGFVGKVSGFFEDPSMSHPAHHFRATLFPPLETTLEAPVACPGLEPFGGSVATIVKFGWSAASVIYQELGGLTLQFKDSRARLLAPDLSVVLESDPVDAPGSMFAIVRAGGSGCSLRLGLGPTYTSAYGSEGCLPAFVRGASLFQRWDSDAFPESAYESFAVDPGRVPDNVGPDALLGYLDSTGVARCPRVGWCDALKGLASASYSTDLLYSDYAGPLFRASNDFGEERDIFPDPFTKSYDATDLLDLGATSIVRFYDQSGSPEVAEYEFFPVSSTVLVSRSWGGAFELHDRDSESEENIMMEPGTTVMVLRR